MSGEFSVGKKSQSRRLARVLAAVLLTFGALWASACGSDDAKGPPPVRKCTLNSDCDSQLVCSFGLCHTQCKESKDCSAGQLCVKTKLSDEGGVCQLEQDEECKFTSDCPNPLVCGPDSKCRTPCNYPNARDCLPGQVCARGGVCADEDEVDEETGGIRGAPLPEGGVEPPGPDGGDGCSPGGTCSLASNPCKAGTYACVNDERVCQESGSAEDGTQCGVDQVCVAGECIACVQDEACQPDESNPCVKGVIDCKTGRVCSPVEEASDGTECGSDKVCVSGVCKDCTAGETCQPDPGDPCVVGKRTCSAGPACEATGNADNGTSCGTNSVCSDGSCRSCVAGSTCEPANVCHRGLTACAGGPVCEDTGQNATDGKPCGSGQYCVSGACQACADGNPCQPTSAPCKKGSTVCSGGQATCNATSANADDGTECGANDACYAGVCTPKDRVLEVKTTVMPTGTIAQLVATPVIVVLKDKDGNPVPNVAVTVTPAPGAAATAVPQTNAQGESAIAVRLGRAVGTYEFSVTAVGVATPVKFTINATAPTDKTIFTIVNADHTSGTTGTPGAGAAARIQAPQALIAASDGTLYIGDTCAVYQLAPSGQLTVIAGRPGTCSSALGDGGQGTDARLYSVRGLALDEANGQLFILDQSNNRVRVLNLDTKVIGTFMGGGLATSAPWGVPGPAGNVVLSSATSIALSPTGDLYVFDTSHSRILKANTQTGATTQFAATQSCTAGGPVRLAGVGDGSSMAWDKDGKMFLSAYFCNLDVSSNVYGVVRVEADGSFSHVAGDDSQSGSKSDGVAAQNAYFTSPPRIAFDGVGNLYVSLRNDELVRRIDAATYRINTVVGSAATNPPVYGDYGPATSAQLNAPEDIVFDAQNNLHVVDSSNYSVRTIWKAGSTTASSYSFTITGGTGQNAVPLDQVFDTLSVKLVDGANANVLNVPVIWARRDQGSSIAATVVRTNAIAGISANNGRVGLLPGPYRFDATYSDLHGNATTRSFTVTAVVPAAGTIFTAMNTSMQSANSGIPGPATGAQTQTTYDAIAASDGTLYLSNFCSIEKVTPAGEISRFAGLPGNCSTPQGDGGPAIDARLYYPRGLALDETNKLLYFADTAYNRIRVIDLQTNTIQALAGGGTATAAPWGDGPAGTNAVFSGAYNISLFSGKLYVPDSSHNLIRTVDVNTTAVATWLTPANCVAGTVVGLAGIDPLSKVLFLPNGDAYISGRLCGSSPYPASPTSANTLGIVRRSAAGAYTHIAGLQSSSATADGIDAKAAYFPDLGTMALDSAGNIYIAVPSAHKVRKIDIATGKITTVAGTGAATSTRPAPDYVLGTASTLYSPQAVALLKGGTTNPGDHLVIADSSNYAHRIVW